MEEVLASLQELSLDPREKNRKEFVRNITNSDQRVTVSRILNGNMTFYLIDYNTKDEVISVNLYGGLSKRMVRERYTVCIENERMSCTCKDFMYRGRAKNIVCKHIVFLVCKVGGIYDNDYFETKILKQSDIRKITNTLENNFGEWEIGSVNKEFKNSKKEFSCMEMCPICCDEFGEMEKVVSCRDCHNFVHTDCIRVWLTCRKTCVYCRSECWESFSELHFGRSKDS